MPVDNRTRAGKHGKDIICTNCGGVARVFHFSWSAIECSDCKKMVNKGNWLVADKMTVLEMKWHSYTGLHDGVILPYHEWLET